MTGFSAAAPIRVGLIGYGYAGRTFHAPLIGSAPGLALRRIASRDPARVAADLPDVTVVADPVAVATADAVDLVVIATPNDTHAPLAQAALAAGKHVVIDKPLTLDLAEARALRRGGAQPGPIAHGVPQPALGQRLPDRPGGHRSRRRRPGAALRIAFRPVPARGPRPVAGGRRPRQRDLVRSRAPPGGSGAPALRSARKGQRQPGAAPARRALPDDWAHVVLDYPGLRVVLHASMLVAGGSPRFLVHGEAGSLIKRGPDPQEQQLLAGLAPAAAGMGRRSGQDRRSMTGPVG